MTRKEKGVKAEKKEHAGIDRLDSRQDTSQKGLLMAYGLQQ